MQVELLKDGPLGKAGRKLSGPEVWRLCLPVKGCVAKPADTEAAIRIKDDLATIRGTTLERVLAEMANAGSLHLDALPEARPEPPRTPQKQAQVAIASQPQQKPEPAKAAINESK